MASSSSSSSSPSPSPSPPSPSSVSPPTVSSNLLSASSLRQSGNSLFLTGDYSKALSRYTKIFAYVNHLRGGEHMGFAQIIGSQGSHAATEEQKKQAEALIHAANANIAACYLKLNQFDKAVQWSAKVLEKEPNNAKALFRRGFAYLQLKEYEKAAEDLTEAAKLQPEDKAIKAALRQAKEHTAKAEEKYKQSFAQAFKSIDLSAKKNIQE